MKTICPNCKREDTMNYDATWGVCNACGWRGNPSAFGFDYAELDKMDVLDDSPGGETIERLEAEIQRRLDRKRMRKRPETLFDDEIADIKESEEDIKAGRLHTMYEDENGNIVVGDDW